MWVLMHTKGLDPCGGPATKAVRKPLATDLITPEIARNLDGSIPRPTDPLLCQSCWKPIWPIDVDDFVDEDA